MAAPGLELSRSNAVCRRVQRDKTVDMLEEEMDTIISRLRTGLVSLRSTRLHLLDQLIKIDPICRMR
jgi:hypothetical protein